MADRFFFDTNVLLYALSANEPAKQQAAREWILVLWGSEGGRISWQVIHEFYKNAVYKLGVPPRVAREAAEYWAQWNPQTPNLSALQRAWHWCDTAQIHFWDGLIVAAAEQSECQWLLSEDFQAGRRFGAVTVVNPFRRQPSEFGLATR